MRNEIPETLPERSPLRAVAETAQTSEINFSWHTSDDEIILAIEMPNGRSKRIIYLDDELAVAYLEFDFTAVKAVGDWDAYYFTDDRILEACIFTFPGDGGLRKIRSMHGVQWEEVGSESDDEKSGDKETDLQIFTPRNRKGHWDLQPLRTPPKRWRLPFPATLTGGQILEIGTPSDRFMVFCERAWENWGSAVNLRIKNVDAGTHDEQKRLLKTISDSLFFDLDTRTGIGLRLGEKVGARTRREKAPIDRNEPPSIRTPRFQYSEKPLSLYWYGRSSMRLPLLEYLAYYQVLEFYFPVYSKRDVLDRLRQELLDPGFAPDSDSDLARVLTIAARSGKGFGAERDQLKATVRACVSDEALRSYIESHHSLPSSLKDPRLIKDVTQVHLTDKGIDLTSRISERIYDLRCRIVHAKEDGGEQQKELLMPYSKEADSLEADIDLVRFLAQKALVASSSRLNV